MTAADDIDGSRNCICDRVLTGRCLRRTSHDLLSGLSLLLLVGTVGCESVDVPPPRKWSPATDPADIGFKASGQPAFDVYDLILWNAVERRWHELLNIVSFPTEKGYVQVSFRLYADGHISNVKILERTVGYKLSVVCWKAVKDLEPFRSWPPEMIKLVSKGYRDIRFTFNYR